MSCTSCPPHSPKADEVVLCALTDLMCCYGSTLKNIYKLAKERCMEVTLQSVVRVLKKGISQGRICVSSDKRYTLKPEEPKPRRKKRRSSCQPCSSPKPKPKAKKCPKKVKRCKQEQPSCGSQPRCAPSQSKSSCN